MRIPVITAATDDDGGAPPLMKMTSKEHLSLPPAAQNFDHDEDVEQSKGGYMMEGYLPSPPCGCQCKLYVQ